MPPPDFIPEEHGVGVPLPPETESGEVNFQDNFGGGVGYAQGSAQRRAPGCVNAADIARQGREQISPNLGLVL